MPFLDWLFGRRREPLPAPEPLPALDLGELFSVHPTPPMETGLSTPSPVKDILPVPPAGAPGIVILDYTVPGHEMQPRRVRVLVGSPGNLVTAIDTDKRRVRHYRLDRIAAIRDPYNGQELTQNTIIGPNAVIPPNDLLAHEDTPFGVALVLRKSMICQLSILSLIARADGSASPRALDRIEQYARRENRFAVNEGWVAAGPKADAWPILRDMIRRLEPRREDLEAYVATLNDDWENPRRFEALNEALSDIARMMGATNTAVRSMASEVERLAERKAR
jgi:hypothetical protein